MDPSGQYLKAIGQTSIQTSSRLLQRLSIVNSNDEGLTWVSLAPFPENMYLYSLSSSANGSIWYGLSNKGFLGSVDYGQNWQILPFSTVNVSGWMPSAQNIATVGDGSKFAWNSYAIGTSNANIRYAAPEVYKVNSTVWDYLTTPTTVPTPAPTFFTESPSLIPSRVPTIKPTTAAPTQMPTAVRNTKCSLSSL